MKKKKNKILTCLGWICVVYWITDFILNALIPHKFSWVLWYSSAGLLFTGIALILQNNKLIYSLFCALFIPETLWLISFLGTFLFHNDIFGLIIYKRDVSFTHRDFYLTLYHFLMPISLFYALIHTSKIYRFGWIGAATFALFLLLLTLILVSPHDQVNCLGSFDPCKTIFSFLYVLPALQRIILAIIFLTVFVYIPTNIGAIKLKEFLSQQS